jgi:flagellar biogenesis protein FliO
MDIVRQTLAILFVFVLLGTALRLIRKKGWTGIKRSRALPDLLQSRGRLVLTPRHSVHVVGIGDRNLVLALHPEGVTFLGDAVPSTACDCPDRRSP